MDEYKHISFKRRWSITDETRYKLGESDAMVQAISRVPLQPDDRKRLLSVSLIKGAQERYE